MGAAIAYREQDARVRVTRTAGYPDPLPERTRRDTCNETVVEHTVSAGKPLLSRAENLMVGGTIVTFTFRVAHALMDSCILRGPWFCEVL